MKHQMAIIGYGGMGGWHHQNVSERIPAIHVKGAYDIRQEALDKAVHNGLYAYSSVEELLADPELDLVTVATPNNFHKDLVIRCLRAGKNVISEKPVAMNAPELEEMMAAAKESVVAAFDSTYKTVKDCRTTLAAKRTAQSQAELDLKTATVKYRKGIISKLAYQQAQDAITTAKLNVESAYLSLYTAYNQYEWAKEGVLITTAAA